MVKAGGEGRRVMEIGNDQASQGLGAAILVAA
jgi:hypothetical protein